MMTLRFNRHEPGNPVIDAYVSACRDDYDVGGELLVFVSEETQFGERAVAFLDNAGNGLIFVTISPANYAKLSKAMANRKARLDGEWWSSVPDKWEVNGEAWYETFTPDIRSLTVATGAAHNG